MISTQSKLPYIFEALHLAPQLDQNFKTHKFCSGNFLCLLFFKIKKIKKSFRPQRKARLRCSRLRSRLRIPPKIEGIYCIKHFN